MVEAEPNVTVGVLVLTKVVEAVPDKPAVLEVCNIPFIAAVPVVPKVNNLVLASNIEAAFTVNVAVLPKVTLASNVTVPKVLLISIDAGVVIVKPVNPVLCAAAALLNSNRQPELKVLVVKPETVPKTPDVWAVISVPVKVKVGFVLPMIWFVPPSKIPATENVLIGLVRLLKVKLVSICKVDPEFTT